jgi:hypothetical protein
MRRYPVDQAPVAQGTERRTSNPRAGGSNPPRRAIYLRVCTIRRKSWDESWKRMKRLKQRQHVVRIHVGVRHHPGSFPLVPPAIFWAVCRSCGDSVKTPSGSCFAHETEVGSEGSMKGRDFPSYHLRHRIRVWRARRYQRRNPLYYPSEQSSPNEPQPAPQDDVLLLPPSETLERNDADDRNR